MKWQLMQNNYPTMGKIHCHGVYKDINGAYRTAAIYNAYYDNRPEFSQRRYHYWVQEETKWVGPSCIHCGSKDHLGINCIQKKEK